MRRLIYSDLKGQLARVAGASGMNVGDARVLVFANMATEELVNEEDWPQLCVWMKFKTTGCHINIPSEFDRLLGLMVNGVPLPLQSPYFEFVGYGPQWPNIAGSTTSWIDQGVLGAMQGVLDREQVATFQDIPSDGTAYYPTIYCNANELVNGIRPVMTLLGYDNNGRWIRSQNTSGQWIDGVQFALNGDTAPYGVTLTQAFSVITGAIKPVTNGYVSIYVSGKQLNFFLASYAPYDTNPFFRRYDIPNLSSGQQYSIACRLRKKFLPIVNDWDYLLIPNLAAMATMIQAIYQREALNFEGYNNFKMAAVDILKKEMKQFVGAARQKPLLTSMEGFGVRRDGVYIL